MSSTLCNIFAIQWNAIIISAIQIKVCEETETVKNNFLIISEKKKKKVCLFSSLKENLSCPAANLERRRSGASESGVDMFV